MPDIMVIGARGIPDAEGGAEKHAEMTFPYFAQKGYSVRLLGIDRFIRQRWFKGVELAGVPTFRFANTDKIVYHFLAFLVAAISRPKLVHLQGLNSALFLALYKLCGLKVVLRYGSADHRYGKWGLFGRFGFRLCEYQLPLADRVIAVSNQYKAELQQRYRLKGVEVIPNGIDTDQVSSESRAYWSRLELKRSGYVLAVGRLTIDKDYDTLIEAVRRIDGQDLDLVIVGGPSEEAYAQHLLSLQSNRIRFLGRLDRSLLPALYENCAVFVNCSLHEGLCNAILEAISYRKPTIVSDIAANRELALASCCYFPVGDASSLAARIKMALASPNAFVADRQHYVDWHDVFVQTEAVYRSVLPTLSAASDGPIAAE